MKIAFFTDNYLPQPSGVATSVDYFARFLQKAGHTVHIYAPKVKGFKEKEEFVFRLPSFKVFSKLPDGARVPIPIPNKSFKKMVECDYDLVHAHGNGAFSLLGLAVARAKKVPYISTFHIQVDQFAHYFLKGRVIKPKFMNKLFLKKFGNLCDGIISPSKKMADQLVHAQVSKDIKIIPNFVELDKFQSQKKGFLRKLCKINPDSPLLLSVGRIGKEKNFEFLVRAFEEVAKVNKKSHLVIVGPDWGEIDKLKKLSKQLDIGKRVHFTGSIKNSDMPKVYTDADIFVFASTAEVHPMVAMEAASASLPLVVVKDRAFSGVVVQNKNGFQVLADKYIFANAVLKLLNDPLLTKEFGEASGKIIKEKYSPEFLISKTLIFYKLVTKNFKERKFPVNDVTTYQNRSLLFPKV